MRAGAVLGPTGAALGLATSALGPARPVLDVIAERGADRPGDGAPNQPVTIESMRVG